MNKITQDMVDDFNAMILLKESAYRVLKKPGDDYAYEVNYPYDRYETHRPMIYPDKVFYGLLEYHFRKYGVEIVYNNTKSIFWSRD